MIQPGYPLASLRCLALAAPFILLAGCGSSSSTAPAPVTFEEHRIGLPPSTLAIVPGHFLREGGIADLAVASPGPGGSKQLTLLTHHEEGWRRETRVTLPDELLFLDAVRLQNRDRLVLGTPDSLLWLDPEGWVERSLARLELDVELARAPLAHMDVSRDVNGDGREDLVLPVETGFAILLQLEDGTFDGQLLVDRPATRTLRPLSERRFSPWELSGIQNVDWDGDGRIDLVAWNGSLFEIHLQRSDGSFSPTPLRAETEVRFESDDPSALVAPYGVRRRQLDREPAGEMTGTILHAITDVDDDGVPDLVLYSLDGGSLWRMRSSLNVHFGERRGSEVIFAPAAGATVMAEGIPFSVELHRVGPGQPLEATFTTIDPGILKAVRMIVSAMFTRSLWMDHEVYAIERGARVDEPRSRRALTNYIPGESGSQSAYPAPALLADVTNDGRADLILGRKGRELLVFVGERDRYAAEPLPVEVSLPIDAELVQLVDLDGDGTLDLVVPRPISTVPSVTLLLSRPLED